MSETLTIISMLSEEALNSLMYYADRAPAGAIVEVGVYRGGSAYFLSQLGRPLFLYDTFEGIPMQGPLDHDNFVGRFSDCSVEEVRKIVPRATVVKGLFPDSIVPMPPVGFVHADADQYQSTKDILRVMPPLMVKGGLILLDDFNIRGCEGCTEAVMESGLPVLQDIRTGKGLIII